MEEIWHVLRHFLQVCKVFSFSTSISILENQKSGEKICLLLDIMVFWIQKFKEHGK